MSLYRINARLDYQPYPPLRLAESFGMGHNHRKDLFVRHRRVIRTGKELTSIDLLGYLPNLHAVPRTGQQINYGLLNFHIAKISIIALHLFQILHLFTVSQRVFNFATCGINSLQRYNFFVPLRVPCAKQGLFAHGRHIFHGR